MYRFVSSINGRGLRKGTRVRTSRSTHVEISFSLPRILKPNHPLAVLQISKNSSIAEHSTDLGSAVIPPTVIDLISWFYRILSRELIVFPRIFISLLDIIKLFFLGFQKETRLSQRNGTMEYLIGFNSQNHR